MNDITGHGSALDARDHPTRLMAPAELAGWLSGLLELPHPTEISTEVVRVDAQAFREWCLAGVGVCRVADDAEPPWTPTLREARDAMEALVLRMTMSRCAGNITHAAAAAGTSRRALRDALRRHDMYSEPARTWPPSLDVSWETVCMLKALAVNASSLEGPVWERVVNAGIQRLRRAGRRASVVRARELVAELNEGMAELTVATVIPGPVVVTLVDRRVLIRADREGATTDAGMLGSRTALHALTVALTRMGGPAALTHEGTVKDD